MIDKIQNLTPAQRQIQIHKEYEENQRRHAHRLYAKQRTKKRHMTRQSRRANRG